MIRNVAVLLACAALGAEPAPLAKDPLAALEKLKALGEGHLPLAPDEARMIADVKDGRFKTWKLEEAGLVASGVAEPRERAARLKEFAAWVAAARAKGKDPRAQGEALLLSLHGKALRRYRSDATSLERAFEKGEFNCVSSALVYNAAAARLGLEARARVEKGRPYVPGHVYSVLLAGGKRIRVEATARKGFAVKEEDEGHREVREAGLVAVVYANRSADSSRDKSFLAGACLGLRAVALDPEDPEAQNNTRAALVNLVKDCIAPGRWEEGAKAARVAVELLPDESALRANRLALFQRWGRHEADAGKPAAALAVLRRAAREIPSEADKFLAEEALVFSRPAEKLAQAGQWEEALAAAAPGLKALEGAPLESLKRWRRGMQGRWAAAERKAGRHDEGFAVLSKARAADPGDRALDNSILYALQESLRDMLDKEGEDDTRKALQRWTKKLDGTPGLDGVVAAHVSKAARKHLAKGDFQEALACIKAHRAMISDDMSARVSLPVYDAWARQHMRNKDWDEAIGVYEKGLAAFPGNGHLKHNLKYCEQQGRAGAWMRGLPRSLPGSRAGAGRRGFLP